MDGITFQPIADGDDRGNAAKVGEQVGYFLGEAAGGPRGRNSKNGNMVRGKWAPSRDEGTLHLVIL